jgi:uncharacterized protein YndB with AHSA1/START domain
MSGYFIAESTGRMEEGNELVWKFPEFEDKVPVKVLKAEPGKLIAYEWDGPEDRKLKVEMTLTEQPGGATLVHITEGKMENDAAGIKWLSGNTEGWANFLACLKAYLEYGINLRKGAFDFMKAR